MRRRISSLIAIVVLLTAAVPSLACVTEKAMNHTESACCRAMHGNCGQMVKQGCCRTDLRTGSHPQLAAGATPTDIAWAVYDTLEPALLPTQTGGISMDTAHAKSPPGRTAATVTVLRI